MIWYAERVRWACLVLLVACSIPELDGTGKACPCADGWVCDEARNLCRLADASTDAPSDAPTDVATDDAATDGGEPDGGEPDGDARDVGVDAVGIDAADGEIDAGSACPHDGLYCISFEDDDEEYDVDGTDLFEIRTPGYMSAAAGYFRSTGDDAYVDFEIEVPTAVYARLWIRADMGSFIAEPTLIAAFFQDGGDDGAGLSVRNEVGTIAVAFTTAGGEGVFSSYTPAAKWSCIQLYASPTTLRMTIDETTSLAEMVSLPNEDWTDFAAGIIDGDHLLGSGISIDEIVIGASPIPCDL